MIAVTVQEIETFAPSIVFVYLAMLLPLIRQILGIVIPGADTSARKASMAIGLSVLLGVIEALTDGQPDTFESISIVAIGIIVLQFGSYEVVLKRFLARLVGDLEPSTETTNTDPLDLIVDGD